MAQERSKNMSSGFPVCIRTVSVMATRGESARILCLLFPVSVILDHLVNLQLSLSKHLFDRKTHTHVHTHRRQARERVPHSQHTHTCMSTDPLTEPPLLPPGERFGSKLESEVELRLKLRHSSMGCRLHQVLGPCLTF